VNYLPAQEPKIAISGIKLLEINANADVDHRIAILRDGISALNKHNNNKPPSSPEYFLILRDYKYEYNL
jgi:uncharacterized small protein (DUF1192 family)